MESFTEFRRMLARFPGDGRGAGGTFVATPAPVSGDGPRVCDRVSPGASDVATTAPIAADMRRMCPRLADEDMVIIHASRRPEIAGGSFVPEVDVAVRAQVRSFLTLILPEAPGVLAGMNGIPFAAASASGDAMSAG